MKRACAWIGNLLFLGLVLNFALHYGTEWKFGPLMMPETLLAADGLHHPNGDEVEAVTLMIAKSGHEQEIYLAMFMTLLGMFACVVLLMVRLYRKEMRRYAGNFRAAMDMGYTLPEEHQKAYFRKVLERYGEPLTEEDKNFLSS